jgi:HlyD family secretion protein
VIAALVIVWIVVANRPTPVEVDVATVSTGPMRVTIDAEGKTRLRDRFTISAPTAGIVSRIMLRAGESVSAGAIIARISTPVLDPVTRAQTTAQLNGAEALRQAAETAIREAAQVMEQARRSAERARAVFESGGISRRDLDEAELALSSAEQQHRIAQSRAAAAAADVARLRAALSDAARGAPLEVRSPVSGRVLRVHEQSQRAVMAGTPLLDVADPGGMEVVVEVLSSEAVRVRPGQTILLEGWGGSDTLRATVRTVGPGAFTRVSALGVEEQRVEVVGDVGAPPAGLGDGYRVSAHIVVWDEPSQRRIPVAALFRQDGDWSTFTVVAGRVGLNKVQIGERSTEWGQLTGGLSEGDTVVLYPSDRVREGVMVKAR